MRGCGKTSIGHRLKTGGIQNNAQSQINIARCLICNTKTQPHQRFSSKSIPKKGVFSAVFEEFSR